jgi:diguanylate cyclase
MDAAVTMQKEAAPKPAPASDLKQVFRNAQRAFDLIQKHRTPPDPKTYAVWYAYVEGH